MKWRMNGTLKGSKGVAGMLTWPIPSVIELPDLARVPLVKN